MGKKLDVKNSLRELSKYFSIKNVSYFSLFLNLASLILGILYIAIPIYVIIWDIFGAILLITLFNNFLLVYINDQKLNKKSKLGNKINILCYGYSCYVIFAMLAMLFNNFFISVSYSNNLMANIGFYGFVYVSYFGVLIIGIIIANFDIKNLYNEKVWNSSQEREIVDSQRIVKTKRILKLTLQVLCYVTMSFGVYFSYVIFHVFYFDSISGILGIFISQFALFGAFILLSATIILLKTKSRKKSTRGYRIIAIIGLVSSGIFLLPLSLTPIAIVNAEKNFSEAFGSNWKSRIDPAAEKYFMQSYFLISGYFLGIPPKDCIVKENVKFYEGEGIELYFDAYMPLNNGRGLPGKNSTIIRIHGGAWTIGDKGRGNMMEMDKYFAAQGYVVFDIQYGLKGVHGESDIITPGYVKGNFNINDMLRQVGYFTKYLSANSKKYGANLGSVFISGGSAGGQLTCATALAISSGKYSSIFGQGLTIKGMIPFYPANLISAPPNMNIGGSPEFLNPEWLVEKNSPPCLIFHGTQDGLVPPYISTSLKNKYTNEGNYKCAIIWLPLGGHGCDIYFSGYYNQVALYYMERFLYLYR
jgi:acetyl esterase/lipase